MGEMGLGERDGSAAAVQWERYLPRTALRVLLVEADDSTRQIISALLRKCSYEVSAVPDGLKAWQILKGKHHNIDLVLTEVELPSISGFALLTLVTEHDVCKNIPVIMMSSHHSISMVLKCMLKGAADFLIKPVRKNELKNLWQHVWRRHTLTGGYVPPNVTATLQKVEVGTDDNTGSNHSSDYVVSSCEDKDISEKKSDAQGLSQSECKLASNLTDSDMETREERAKLPQESIIQNSESEDNPSKFGSKVALRQQEEHDCVKGEVDEPLSGAIDFIGTFDDHSMFSHLCSGSTNGGSDKFESTPQLELSLRRFCAKDDKIDEGHALNHPNASAISWYNNSKTLHSFFPTMAGTCTELEEGIVNEEESFEAMEELRLDVSSSSGQSCSTSVCNGAVTQVSSNAYGSICTRSDGVTGDMIEQANASENSNDGSLMCHDGIRTTGSVRSSEREAALTKFRLKRKDRCYEKKVRYQSRKRLAEQRPRVKGQFVRQAHTESSV